MHILGVLTCAVLGLFHMVSAYGGAQAFGQGFDYTWVMYIQWVFKTPLLLVAMGLLVTMPAAEVRRRAGGGT
jgi:hypothetical protein